MIKYIVLCLFLTACNGPAAGDCQEVQAPPLVYLDDQPNVLTCTCFDGATWDLGCPRPVEVIPF